MKSILSKYQKSIDLIINEKPSIITSDSRKVESNAVFVAIDGIKYKAIDIIPDAINAGAKIIVTNHNINYPNVKTIYVDDPRRFLGYLLNQFYNIKLNIIAVTGTSGKTSVVNFYQQILSLLGITCATIGTLGIIKDGVKLGEIDHTTPDPVYLYKYLKQLQDLKTDYIAIEASSHGLDQYKIDALDIKAAAFTNFSQDHLDYHHNFFEYLNAKKRLFNEIVHNGYAILNSDINEFEELKNINLANNNEIIDYGKSAKLIKLVKIESKSKEQNITLQIDKKRYNFTTKLLGEFQIYNILCAIGLIISHKMDSIYVQNIINILPKLEHIEGRMQKLDHSKRNIYIDYSHKPEALEKALKVIRQITQGRVIVVFGCGGNRDKSKRPIMGKIATDLADLVIITDDNPRSEDPKIIRSEIINGSNKFKILEIDGRDKAIYKAIDLMVEEDVLLIAGKGHENTQIIANEVIYFSDYETAFDYLSKVTNI